MLWLRRGPRLSAGGLPGGLASPEAEAVPGLALPPRMAVTQPPSPASLATGPERRMGWARWRPEEQVRSRSLASSPCSQTQPESQLPPRGCPQASDLRFLVSCWGPPAGQPPPAALLPGPRSLEVHLGGPGWSPATSPEVGVHQSRISHKPLLPLH